MQSKLTRAIHSGKALLALLLLAMLTVPHTAANAQSAERVIFGTGSSISLTSAPMIMAVGMGYFEDEGIDIEVVPFPGGSGVLIPQIENKSITVGFPTTDPLIKNREPGRDYLPLKFFYNMTRASIYEIVVLEDSDINTLEDLEGANIGVGALTWGSIPIARAMLRAEAGLAEEADYNFIAVGMGGAAYQALIDGEIDALYLFDVPHAQLEGRGVNIRRLYMPERYAGLGSNSLMAHEDTIETQGDMLGRFGRAIAKGTVACDANPEACVRVFWELYPEQKPTEGTEEEILSQAVMVLNTRLQRMLHFPEGTERNFGEFPREMWSNYVEVLYEGGELSTADIDLDSLYTNAFVEQFNDFDHEAVKEEARALN